MPERKPGRTRRSRNVSREGQSPGVSGENTYVLEQGTLEQLTEAKAKTEAYLRYYWCVYAEFAHQRDRIKDDLFLALNESSCGDYEFEQWQRALKYRYSLEPLRVRGSIKDLGGRFNFGEDINLNIMSFPALYLASDKDTALQETLGQSEVGESELSAHDLALMNPQSESIVSVSGQLERIIDIREADSLEQVANLLGKFQLSSMLVEQANHLGEEPPEIVRTPGALRKSLLEKRWRVSPRLFDVPSNSQIFGHLVMQAGIDGILYPSALTGKDCLAVFPCNLERTTSFIQLDDPGPPGAAPTRLDGSNWRESE